MNIDQSKERIIEMYFEEHKSQREISRIEGRSLRDVNNIIKAHRNKSEIKELPSDSNIGRNDNRAPKAYALYEKQYSPVRVAVRLKIDANEAMQYYSDFLGMKSLGNLVTIHQRIGNKGISLLLNMCNAMQTESLSLQETLEAIRAAGSRRGITSDFVSKTSEFEELQNSICGSQAEKQKLSSEIRKMTETTTEMRAEVETTSKELMVLRRTVKEEERKVRTLRNKRYLIENSFETVRGHNSERNYEFRKWLNLAGTRIAEEHLTMIVESVFHAILREPLRTQLVLTLQNQTADIHTNTGKREIALLTEMSKPIVEQIVDREINLAAKQLRSKILEEQNPRREELESKKYRYAVDNN